MRTTRPTRSGPPSESQGLAVLAIRCVVFLGLLVLVIYWALQLGWVVEAAKFAWMIGATIAVFVGAYLRWKRPDGE
jgi:hypothetical protein